MKEYVQLENVKQYFMECNKEKKEIFKQLKLPKSQWRENPDLIEFVPLKYFNESQNCSPSVFRVTF